VTSDLEAQLLKTWNSFLLPYRCVYAALAEKERRLISQQPGRHWQPRRRKGVKMGGVNTNNIALRRAAQERAEQLRPIVTELLGMSHRSIAAALNERKVPTPAGGRWHSVTVKRVLERLGFGDVTAKCTANQREAQERAEQLRPIFAKLAGRSLRAMATALNKREVPTPTGGRWHAVTVKRVLERLG
jgi:Recombinase